MEKIKSTYKYLFIIGAAKAGTTFLYDQLIDHPQLVGADHLQNKFDKEPRLLLRDDIDKKKFEEAFQHNARKKPDGNILVDASTCYTKWPQSFLLNSKFEEISDEYFCIYIIRDPVDRFESHINYNAKRRFFLENNLCEILKSESGKNYLNIGNYAMQLFGYKEIWKNKKLLIIDFNNLIKNTKETIEEICNKLKLDTNLLPKKDLRKISNKTSDYSRNSPRIFDNPLLRNSIHKLIPDAKNRAYIFENYHKLFKSKGYPKRLLSDSEKTLLAQIYKPSLMNLNEEYGINFYESSWTTIKKFI